MSRCAFSLDAATLRRRARARQRLSRRGALRKMPAPWCVREGRWCAADELRATQIFRCSRLLRSMARTQCFDARSVCAQRARRAFVAFLPDIAAFITIFAWLIFRASAAQKIRIRTRFAALRDKMPAAAATQRARPYAPRRNRQKMIDLFFDVRSAKFSATLRAARRYSTPFTMRAARKMRRRSNMRHAPARCALRRRYAPRERDDALQRLCCS